MCDRLVSDIHHPDRLNAAGMPVTVGNLLDMASGEMFPWYKAHFLPSPVMPSCRIPDDCIDSKRYPLFIARAVLKELIESLQSIQGVKPC